MGIDWIRMRPRHDDARLLLMELIKGQADQFTAAHGMLWPDWDFLGLPEYDLHEVPTEGQQLLARIEIDDRAESCIRVSRFSAIEVIPAEWRRAAYRTHLPDEVPDLLDTWIRHLDEVRQGRHLAYLAAWHAYLTSRALEEEWKVIRSYAVAALHRTNAWMRKPGVAEASEQVLNLPVPAVSPPPHWGATPAEVLPTDWTPYVEAAAAWNSQARSGYRTRLTPIRSVEEFVADELASADLGDCLAWLGKAESEGYGLWLDY
ncbi:hypothetical protein [Spirillospora sp. CA-294931]|uniref:hypothetical protein n=1 Tax=Spirillospora sp. CA-294931 TaxID=3240042 RepID=UPI003D943F2E